ncbi:Maf1 regulator-domain-containing protein [Lentinula novae-zelandiae]|nr:Maf1 regulator-domain-containing protein [Lentinula novae-zelandiae]
MKYIELPSLTALASSLSHQGSECNVSVRLEAYSCKNIKRDKRLFRDLEKVYWDDMCAHSSLSTPFGPLGSPQSRKTLYLLISTLNVAFPDYTFDSVKPSSFVHLESGAQILNALSTTLLASQTSVRSHTSRHNSGYASMAYGAYPAAQGLGFGVPQGSPGSPYEFIKESPCAPSSVISGTHPEVYALLDDVIGPLDECEVFEYVPEPEEDPNAGEGEEDGDEDFEDGLEGYLPDEEHVFTLDEDINTQSDKESHSTLSTPVTPRDAVLSTSVNSISPFDESYRPLGGNTLLWSSHWFFLNRKQKRILYVTVWARKRSMDSMPETPVDEELFPTAGKERFLGWEGAAGAGARALGLVV